MAYYSTPRVTETAEGKTMDKEKPLYQLFWGEKLGNGSRGLPLISLILCCLKILKRVGKNFKFWTWVHVVADIISSFHFETSN